MSTRSPVPAWSDTPELRLLRETAGKFFGGTTDAADWIAHRPAGADRWRAAGDLGLLCCSVPDEYGGGDGSFAADLVVIEEQYRALESGFGTMVHSGIVAHYLLAYGSEEQKHRWLPPMADGSTIGAIAMTEPDAGSDLKAITTRARREGDQYVITGSKTFISNGSSAELIIVACKTDVSAGSRGMSLMVVETPGCAGFRRGRTLDKIGQHTADTAELHFDEVRVPVTNLLGEEGRGFGYLMAQLAQERLLIAAAAQVSMERAVEETVAYVKDRRAFGGTLFDKQNTRFELAECATIARVGRAFLDDCVSRHLDGRLDAATASMAKYWLSDRQCEVIDRCLQLFGGYGYMAEYPIARLHADARPQRIYGGSNEVMKDLVARSL